MKLVFLTLTTFKCTGGIETVCKSWYFAFNKLEKIHNLNSCMISLHDKKSNYSNLNYIPCDSNPIKCIYYLVKYSFTADYLVISHINLSLFYLFVKLINPKLKLIIILVYNPFDFIKLARFCHQDSINFC